MKRSDLKQIIRKMIEEEKETKITYEVGDVAGKDWDETEILKFIKKSAKENSKIAEAVQFYLDWFGVEKLEDIPEKKQFSVYSALQTKANTLLGLKVTNPQRTVKRKFEKESPVEESIQRYFKYK